MLDTRGLRGRCEGWCEGGVCSGVMEGVRGCGSGVIISPAIRNAVSFCSESGFKKTEIILPLILKVLLN